MHYFNYEITFTIPEGPCGGWKHTIDIEFLTSGEIIQELSVRLHESGALQQVQHDDGSDDYHDVELDEDDIDNLFQVTAADTDWEALGYDVNAGLDDLLGCRDEIAMVIRLDPEPEELIGIWKALVRLVGKEYVDIDEIREDYVGRFDSMKDFAIEHVETLGDIPEIVKNNINWRGVAGDLESDYNYDEESGHLFRA